MKFLLLVAGFVFAKAVVQVGPVGSGSVFRLESEDAEKVDLSGASFGAGTSISLGSGTAFVISSKSTFVGPCDFSVSGAGTGLLKTSESSWIACSTETTVLVNSSAFRNDGLVALGRKSALYVVHDAHNAGSIAMNSNTVLKIGGKFANNGSIIVGSEGNASIVAYIWGEVAIAETGVLKIVGSCLIGPQEKITVAAGQTVVVPKTKMVTRSAVNTAETEYVSPKPVPLKPVAGLVNLAGLAAERRAADDINSYAIRTNGVAVSIEGPTALIVDKPFVDYDRVNVRFDGTFTVVPTKESTDYSLGVADGATLTIGANSKVFWYKSLLFKDTSKDSSVGDNASLLFLNTASPGTTVVGSINVKNCTVLTVNDHVVKMG